MDFDVSKLKQVTEPQVFDPPKEHITWSYKEGKPVHIRCLPVIAILPKLECHARVIAKDGYNLWWSDNCAEVPQELESLQEIRLDPAALTPEQEKKLEELSLKPGRIIPEDELPKPRPRIKDYPGHPGQGNLPELGYVCLPVEEYEKIMSQVRDRVASPFQEILQEIKSQAEGFRSENSTLKELNAGLQERVTALEAEKALYDWHSPDVEKPTAWENVLVLDDKGREGTGCWSGDSWICGGPVVAWAKIRKREGA